MTDIFCACVYKTLIDEPVSTWSTTIEFLFSVAISICGVIVNYRFRKKLQEEKRNKPIGRKGNVIEPVMSWFCVLQIIFWPYELLLIWLAHNAIVPFYLMPGWLCSVWYTLMHMGRLCIAYNSLFIAFIRYVYIVHQQRSNQWDFEKTGKRFQVFSIAIPITMETIRVFTDPGTWISKSSDRFEDCADFYQGSNSTDSGDLPKPAGFKLTINYLPEALVFTIYYIYLTITVVVLTNIVEAFLYFRIFRSIRR